MGGYVYILASRRHGTLYIGVTSDLVGRVWQHREGVVPGFTRKYGVHRLVYFEEFGSIVDAIEREKRLEKWRRDWKIRLIEQANPEWLDLYDNLARWPSRHACDVAISVIPGATPRRGEAARNP